MDSPGEILRLCRLCLVKDQVNIPIFEEQGDRREIFLKISSCLPVKVSREDRLPKKICDGCSEKLNSFYEFWSSSANAEKTLLSWVGEEEEKKEPAKSIAASAPLVKEESEAGDDAHAESVEESTKDEAEAPPAKRARRSAAVKAQINLAPDSEDDDLDMAEPLTKMEEESADSDGEDKDPSYTEMPGTSADDEQAGPSGMGKDGVEAPEETIYLEVEEPPKPQNNRIIPRLMHWCHICGKCFNRNLDLNKHFAFVHFGDKRHQCKHCTANYKEKESLLNHMKRAHKQEKPIEWVLCETCGTTCSDQYQLKKHNEEKHAKSSRVTCEWCHEDFESERLFKTHFKKHTRQVVKTCDLCQEPFYVLSKYRQHMRTSHTDEYLVCAYCSKLVTSQEELTRHEDLHNIKLEECPVCQKRVKNLKDHLAEVHFLEEVQEPEERTWVCDVCGDQFKSAKHLKRHMAQHKIEEIEN